MKRTSRQRWRPVALAARVLLVALLVAAVSSERAWPLEPPSAPMLRIETTMHAGMVRRIVVDRTNLRLISAGDDKTIRVWQLPAGRLLRVLRFPIGPGHEGRLTGIALAPDGRTLAAGGWTGWDWDRKASLYLFDLESGELIRRVEGFPETIGDIEYSPDGRYLAVGMTARGGLRVLRTSDYKQVAEDREFNDKVLGVEFHPSGALAVASIDGLLRLYDDSFKLIGRKHVAPGKTPMIVRFSPDGDKLAVSFDDAPVISVYRTRDLTPLYTTDARNVTGQIKMSDTAWSADGEYLFGVGERDGIGANSIYRWSQGGRGELRKIAVAGQRVTDIRQLPGGGIAFASEDPSVGLIDRDGSVIFRVGSSLTDFHDREEAFRISNDGAVVRFANVGKPAVATFSLLQRTLTIGEAAEVDLAPPLRKSRTLKLIDWKDTFTPKLNGVALAMDDYEVARSYAVTPDDQSLILGTEWAIKRYDRKGKQLWKTPTLGVVWNVGVTGDGSSIVATLSDGTVRWYRSSDGVEYLALFPHANGEDWIAWTPQGYYVSSNFGDQYVGWQINRGKDKTPDFYRAVQFERILYRPDLVEESFRNRGAEQPSTRTLQALFDISQLATIAPPRVRLSAITSSGASGGSVHGKITFTAEQGPLPMQDYAVFVNNIPITPARLRTLAGGERNRVTREIALDLTERENLVRIEVFNGRSLGLAEAYIDLREEPPAPQQLGNLYVLAVGVKQFPGLSKADLAYTDRDAEELAATLKQQNGVSFKNVAVKVITDNTEIKPAHAQVLEALKFLEVAEPRDTVVLFLASHGISDIAGNYYFVPADATQVDVAAVNNSATPPQVKSLIGWSSFFESLRRTAGRRIVIVDTCQARNMEGKLDVHSLSKRSASSRFALMVASKGSEQSQEYAKGQHGLFTYALLRSLRGEGDRNNDRRVTLSEAFAGVVPLVEELRYKNDARVGTQTPQLVAPIPLDQTVLTVLPQGATASNADKKGPAVVKK